MLGLQLNQAIMRGVNPVFIYVGALIKVGGNLLLPNLLFPPLRFQNSKFGIGKNRDKLAKIWEN